MFVNFDGQEKVAVSRVGCGLFISICEIQLRFIY